MGQPSFIGHDPHAAQFLKIARQTLPGRIFEAEQIRIPRDAVQRQLLKREKHRPFQDELFPVAGPGQKAKQTLQGEPHEQHAAISTSAGPALGWAGAD